ncbi:MAG: ABC transporter ATP-binding protein, partial [Thermodesulfobacteriota bacterium]
QTGSPEDVMKSPVNEIAASLIGMENILPGEVVSTKGNTLTVQIEGKPLGASEAIEPGRKVFLTLR